MSSDIPRARFIAPLLLLRRISRPYTPPRNWHSRYLCPSERERRKVRESSQPFFGARGWISIRREGFIYEVLLWSWFRELWDYLFFSFTWWIALRNQKISLKLFYKIVFSGSFLGSLIRLNTLNDRQSSLKEKNLRLILANTSRKKKASGSKRSKMIPAKSP